MVTERLTRDAAALLERLRQRGWLLATAESCTGGLIAATLTEVPGSSDVLERGFVTYSNTAKRDMLGVGGAALERHGAVSEDVAIAMAEGALRASRANISVSVTGIAGPGGGSATKPVGLVHLACAARGHATMHQRHVFADRGRTYIRVETVAQALRLVTRMLDDTAR